MVLLIGLTAVHSLPTRIVGDGQVAEPTVFLQETTHNHAIHSAGASIKSGDTAGALDFSLLNDLVDESDHQHRHHNTRSSSLAEVESRTSAGTVGGVDARALDRFSDTAVDSTLHLMGLDTPLVDEPDLDIPNTQRVLDQERPTGDALLQLEQHQRLQRVRDRNEAKHARHSADTGLAPHSAPPAAERAAAPARNSFSSESEARAPNTAAQDEQLNFLQFHNSADVNAKMRRHRNRPDAKAEQQQAHGGGDSSKDNAGSGTGPAYALQEQQASVWPDFDHPNSDFKLNRASGNTPQPSHKELHEFLRRSLPAQRIGGNYRFREDPPAQAPAGGKSD